MQKELLFFQINSAAHWKLLIIDGKIAKYYVVDLLLISSKKDTLSESVISACIRQKLLPKEIK